MSKSVTVVRHKAKPGMRDEVRRVWEKYASEYIARSSGVLSCIYSYDDADPDAVIVYSLATDAAVGLDFTKQPWFADYQRETAALIAGPPEVRTATPQWEKAAAA